MDRRVAELAERQHGVVSRAQLLELGVGYRAISRRVAAGALHRIHNGAYAVGHSALSQRGRYMAAVLACGPDAALSHHSGADLRGIIPSGGPRVHVSVVSRSYRPQSGIALHRPRTLSPDEVTIVDGIPVTTPARTLLDLADRLSLRRLARACDTAERARLLDWAEAFALIDRHPHKVGARRLQRVLIEHGVAIGADPARSDLERKLFAFCAAHGFPAPLRNHTILGVEADFCWPEHRLIAETDGWDVHRTRFAFESDRARDLALVAAGWRVVRVTEARIEHDAPRLERDMRALFRTA